MLHHISTSVFVEGIALLTAIYYIAVVALYYPKEIKNRFKRPKARSNLVSTQLFDHSDKD